MDITGEDLEICKWRELTAHPANPPAIPLLIAYSRLCFSIFLFLLPAALVETSGIVAPIDDPERAVSLIGADGGVDCCVFEGA
jgi:hypothetical protein